MNACENDIFLKMMKNTIKVLDTNIDNNNNIFFYLHHICCSHFYKNLDIVLFLRSEKPVRTIYITKNKNLFHPLFKLKYIYIFLNFPIIHQICFQRKYRKCTVCSKQNCITFDVLEIVLCPIKFLSQNAHIKRNFVHPQKYFKEKQTLFCAQTHLSVLLTWK